MRKKLLLVSAIVLACALFIVLRQGSEPDDGDRRSSITAMQAGAKAAGVSLQAGGKKAPEVGDRFVTAWGIHAEPAPAEDEAYLNSVGAECPECRDTLEAMRAAYLANCKNGKPSVETMRKWRKGDFYLLTVALTEITKAKVDTKSIAGYCIDDANTLPSKLNQRDFDLVQSMPLGDVSIALNKNALHTSNNSERVLDIGSLAAARIWDRASFDCAAAIIGLMPRDEAKEQMRSCMLDKLRPENNPT